MKRREFVNKTTLVLASGVFAPKIDLVHDSDVFTILFQGDSITDAGRDRSRYYANNASGLGSGYVGQVATELLGTKTDKTINIYNRGISGDKVPQLAARWKDDCMQLKPTILSVMVGVNDFWHTLTHGYEATSRDYVDGFYRLMSDTKSAIPDIKIIIAEPFYVPDGTAINNDIWKSGFPIYQKGAEEVAQKIGAEFIPLQSIFNIALSNQPVSYWCPDGVHPSLAGSYLMSEAWLKVLNKIII
jgi:lysophospholipase L1-like esterase